MKKRKRFLAISLNTSPGIRATNTSGKFAVQASYSVDYGLKTGNTGVISIVVPDR